MTVFYNEINHEAAEHLRSLIAADQIAPGVVDERSIEDVCPDELAGFTQCHFFAGIGIWSLALRAAGIPDDAPLWTGSCPCQPFSAAGKGDGMDDERHLWPAWFHLISQRRPVRIFGEQVASKDTGPWIDLVHDDLEAMGYAVGAVPFPAAGIGAPNIRDRLYWAASAGVTQGDTGSTGLEGYGWHGDHGNQSGRVRAIEAGSVAAAGGAGGLAYTGRVDHRSQAEAANYGQSQANGPADRVGGCSGASSGLAIADNAEWRSDSSGWNVAHGAHAGRSQSASHSERLGEPGCVADSTGARHTQARQHERGSSQLPARLAEHGGMVRPAGPVNGYWAASDWLHCRDGKWRPVEPGTFPLAHGLPRSLGALSPELQRLAEVAGLSGASLKGAKAYRIGGLKGYGNAINAIAAQAFIESSFEALATINALRKAA